MTNEKIRYKQKSIIFRWETGIDQYFSVRVLLFDWTHRKKKNQSEDATGNEKQKIIHRVSSDV